MARSSYIYVVVKDKEPIATFTVKHECRTWLNKIITVTSEIWVFRDNSLIPEVKKFTLKEFLNSE